MNRLWSVIATRPSLCALVLVFIASLRIVSTYRVLNHTTDEPAHLAAGIEWLQNGTYTYEDQHPPLARVTGAIGLYLTGSRWTRNKDMYKEGYLLLGQGKRYNRALFYSRLCMLPFFWIAAAVVYLWSFRTGGGGPAVFATFLFTTTPPVLAHAGLATTDMALTAFVTATLLASLSLIETPDWKRSIGFGLCLGLALLSKFSALVFLPAAWILMYAAYLLTGWSGFRHEIRKAVTLLPWAALSLLTTGFVIWAGYRFNAGNVPFLHARLPAPAFFTGIRYVYLHNREGHLAYLMGKLSQTGFWYYYPVVLAVKTPLATLLIMAAAVWFAVWKKGLRAIAMPLALAGGILCVGLFSHINIGVRHILPIYSAFAICGGWALNSLLRTNRRWLVYTASALLLWQSATGALQHPDYLSYTNELAGRHPERILADSDLDWDQGMRGLALRLQQLGIRKLTFKLNGTGYMEADGHSFPAYDYMPDGNEPRPGWNAVCITAWKLSGQPKWAERIEPTERIRGGSIYLYYFPPPMAP